MEKEKTPQFQIRTATPQDVVAIRTMHAKSWLATYPNDEHDVSSDWVKQKTDQWLTPESLEKSTVYLAETLNDSKQFYRVATDGDAIVGIIHITTKADGSKHLGALYLDEDYKGKGLAQQLMRTADEWLGDTSVDLEVASYNARAIRFYEKEGFKVEPGSDHMYNDKIPVLTMVREGKSSEV